MTIIACYTILHHPFTPNNRPNEKFTERSVVGREPECRLKIALKCVGA